MSVIAERAYLDLLAQVKARGDRRMDRTGVGTRSLFGERLEFDLGMRTSSRNTYPFPLLTTKKLHLKSIIYELLWMIRGETNVKWLNENKVSIWDEWADEQGDLGPIYGKQWRDWESPHGNVDQLQQVINSLRDDPYSRRHVVSAWNPGELPFMALSPCHCLFQFYVSRGYLSCQLYQRSADIFLGVPFNIASYALLTMMVAKVTGLQPGKFVHVFGDVHLYENHVEAAEIQLERIPLGFPVVTLANRENIEDFQFGDFKLEDYNSWNAIPAPVAV